jgi:hypothetical protein
MRRIAMVLAAASALAGCAAYDYGYPSYDVSYGAAYGEPPYGYYGAPAYGYYGAPAYAQGYYGSYGYYGAPYYLFTPRYVRVPRHYAAPTFHPGHRFRHDHGAFGYRPPPEAREAWREWRRERGGDGRGWREHRREWRQERRGGGMRGGDRPWRDR